MPAVILSAKQSVINIIKKFRFEELEAAVLPVFPEFSWKNIKSQLVENHESLTTVRAVKIIEEEINKARLNQDTLRDRQALLEVIDASRHYMRRFWYTLEFKGTSTVKSLKTDELEEKIETIFTTNHLEIGATAIKHNGYIFLSIKERPKKKSRKSSPTPVFFSILPKEKYFFTSKKILANHIILAVAEAMGYKGYKNIKLDGRNIPSLVRLLNARKVAELTGFPKKIRNFKVTAPEKSSNGFDFTQHKQRKEFAEKCFGDDPPIFETLKVISKDEKWKHKKAQHKLPNEIIYTGIRFRSQNIVNFLKELVAEKVLETPLPAYAINVLSLGRNQITVRKTDISQL